MLRMIHSIHMNIIDSSEWFTGTDHLMLRIKRFTTQEAEGPGVDFSGLEASLGWTITSPQNQTPNTWMSRMYLDGVAGLKYRNECLVINDRWCSRFVCHNSFVFFCIYLMNYLCFITWIVYVVFCESSAPLPPSQPLGPNHIRFIVISFFVFKFVCHAGRPLVSGLFCSVAEWLSYVMNYR